MLPDLVSSLRCIRPHEDSWLVAASYRTDGGHIVDGVLGCPVCRAEYPVRGGVVDFTDRGEGAATDAAGSPDAHVGVDAAEEAMRLAALLELAEPRLPVVLAGAWGGLLPALERVVPGATWLLVNAVPPAGHDALASGLRVTGRFPLAAGAVHGVALDDAGAADAGLVAGAVRALRGGGRLVAPAAAPVPGGVQELAHDARHWVAERVAEPTLTPPQPLLRRR